MSLKIKRVPEFANALKTALQLGKKTEAQLLNEWAVKVCFQAYKLTVKAKRETIRAELYKDRFALRYVWAIVAKKGEKLTQAEGRKRVRKMIAARLRSIGYIALGFLQVAKDFGATVNAKVNPKSEAAKSYGKRAKAALLKAFVGNNSIGADKVALGALEQAMRIVAAKEKAYATRTLQKKAFDPVNGKRK